MRANHADRTAVSPGNSLVGAILKTGFESHPSRSFLAFLPNWQSPAVEKLGQLANNDHHIDGKASGCPASERRSSGPMLGQAVLDAV